MLPLSSTWRALYRLSYLGGQLWSKVLCRNWKGYREEERRHLRNPTSASQPGFQSFLDNTGSIEIGLSWSLVVYLGYWRESGDRIFHKFGKYALDIQPFIIMVRGSATYSATSLSNLVGIWSGPIFPSTARAHSKMHFRWLPLKGFRRDVFLLTRATQTKASHHEFEKQIYWMWNRLKLA